MRVCDIVDVDIILEVAAGTKDEGGLTGCDAGVDDWDTAGIIRAEDGR